MSEQPTNSPVDEPTAGAAQVDGAGLAKVTRLPRRRVGGVGGEVAGGGGVVEADPAAPDEETTDLDGATVGGPVDPPGQARRFGPPEAGGDPPGKRRALVPGWMRTRAGWAGYTGWLARESVYFAAFHLLRTPKYVAKAAVFAPWGALRLAGRVLRWASAEEGNAGLRQVAAFRNDAESWLKLDRTRERQSRFRFVLLAVALVFAVVAAAVVVYGPGHGLLPAWVPWTVLTVLVPVLARFGRPEDKPITDRVTQGPRFVRLTAAMVRGALCTIGLPGVKDPAQVTFPVDIHRDGPGWLARVNLPAGVEATDVLERRGKMSSALRLPVDQVWPAPGPDHAGQLDLWVGYQPASKMGQPAWSLARPTARTSVFEPHEFGTDERQRPVRTELFARNFLIGGVPGSGKSFAARTITVIAALDPTTQLLVVEFKGTGDFSDIAPLCSTYACGVTDTEFQVGLDVLTWGLAEAERRGERIRRARERGDAPEGKVTPELARKRGSGLHPIVIVIDEAHELFGDATVGKEAAVAAERLIKRGRALGIIVVLATQIPDSKSLPPNITRCVNMRWCLAVQDQVANDMILGTGAYKRGVTGTVYRPGADAGWGVMTGLAAPTAVRSHYPKPEVTAAIVARAAALRGGRVVGGPTEAPARSVLTDTVAVFADAERGLHWETIAARLTERFPEHYRAATAETVSAQLRAAGVPSVDVKAKGATRKGARLTAILAAGSTTGSDSDGDSGDEIGSGDEPRDNANPTNSTVTDGDEDAG